MLTEKTFSSISSVLIVNYLLILTVSVSQTGAVSCILKSSETGTCVKFKECSSTLILPKNHLDIEYCDLENGIVCCADNNQQIRDLTDNEPQPYSASHAVPGHFHKRQIGIVKPNSDSSDTYEISNNFERRKRRGANRNNLRKRKDDYENIDEDMQHFEGNLEDEDRFRAKPFRRPNDPNRQTYDYYEDSYFIPPGLEKKKPWRDEKTTESEYTYEYVPKKPLRGPHRKGNKHNGNHYYTNNNPKWVDDGPTKNVWSNQEQTTPNNNNEWYGGHNDNQNGYFNPRTTTTTRYEWTKEVTTRRNHNSGDRPRKRPNNRPGNKPNNRPGNRPINRPEDNHGENVYEPTRGTHRPSVRPPNPTRPTFQQGSEFQETGGFNTRPVSTGRLRISELMCLEYSKEITKNITGLPLTTDPDPIVIPVRKCVQAQQLIVGGENTTLGEFPHMAAIGFLDRNKRGIAWNCGGTLISEQFVLTAAHCTSTSSGPPIRVRLGEYNLMKDDDGAHPVDYSIADIITHPEYKPPSKYNDIALLRLSRRVTFFNHIRPACLYSDSTFETSRATATGWGRLSYDGSTSEILQKVVLSIVDNNTCNRLYKINIKTDVLSRGIVGSQLCAGELSGGKDTCQGDSGGPLTMTNTKCIHHIIGITSFGRSCALPNSTGVYTRVSAYVPWIENVVWPTN